jgi:hypothetical protein
MMGADVDFLIAMLGQMLEETDIMFSASGKIWLSIRYFALDSDGDVSLLIRSCLDAGMDVTAA